MDLKILRPRPLRRSLLGIEKLTLFYAVLTSVAIVILWPHVSHPVSLLLQRWLLCGAMIIPYFAYRWYPSRMTKFLRIFYVMALLGYWYPDTYNICSTMPYLDHVFASADQWIFGFQPAEWFSRIFSSRVFSEAFYLGYLSYFPIIVFVTFYAWLRKYQQLEYTTFVIMCSFFLFYTVFLFLPVAGPQFYYPLLSAGQLQGGVFPPVPHDYFVLHPQIQEIPTAWAACSTRVSVSCKGTANGPRRLSLRRTSASVRLSCWPAASSPLRLRPASFRSTCCSASLRCISVRTTPLTP